VPWNRNLSLNDQNRIGIQYFLKQQKVWSRQTPLQNGNSRVRSTADNELAPAAELELLEYIFREVLFFSFAFARSNYRKIKEASDAVTTASLQKVAYSFMFLC
jgi:hypothetical protein